MKNLVRRSLKALPFAAAALAAGLPGAANAVAVDCTDNPGTSVIEYCANIFTSSASPFLQVYNDRAGVGRTFRNVTGDRIRSSAYVFPSRDSNRLPFDSLGNLVDPDMFAGPTYLTLNGDATTVNVRFTPVSSGVVDAPASIFVGLTSGLGGGRHEYTRVSPLLSEVDPALITDAYTNPVKFVIRNPSAPSGPTEIVLTGPDYNPGAMPGFVNNITISGGGLNPTLNWNLPADTEEAISLLHIRKVQGAVGDPDDPFLSTLIARKALGAGVSTYTIDNADFNVFPGVNGLEMGAQYEVAVQLFMNDPTPSADLRQSPLQGISRTFFEFTPLANDVGDIAVYLPSVDAEGVYHFDFEVVAETPVVIDPVIAVGYDYEVGAGDPLFASVTLPELDGAPVTYSLYLFDAGDNPFDTLIDIVSGTIFDFTSGALAAFGDFSGGLSKFGIRDIPVSAMLDPTDVSAFMTTLTFAGNGQFTGTMTAITEDVPDVPEPMTLSLFGGGLFGLGWARRRRIHA